MIAGPVPAIRAHADLILYLGNAKALARNLGGARNRRAALLAILARLRAAEVCVTRLLALEDNQ